MLGPSLAIVAVIGTVEEESCFDLGGNFWGFMGLKPTKLGRYVPTGTCSHVDSKYRVLPLLNQL
jgi:hypothetical protein